MAEVPYEPKLPSPDASFSLSDEQRETARFLAQILGRSVAERFTDFCTLSYGSLPLRAPSPLAAHSLRELNSSFFDSLEGLAGVRRQPTNAEKDTLDKARAALLALGYQKDEIERGLKEIGKGSYASAIRKIATWLGLDPVGDIARTWIKFKDLYRKVHERKHNRSLAVDDDFRDEWARPFEMVVRAVAVALEGKYHAFMSKVDDLTRMTDAGAALTLFEKEIPGAPPLQWHFFNSIDGPEWLPEIIRRRLIVEPVTWASDDNEARIFGEWPVGQYLSRMAKHQDLETRKLVIVALRSLTSSKHPDVRRSGLEIISHLPPDEVTSLTDVITGWLTKDTYLISLTSTESIVKRLAEAGFRDEALKVASTLFQVFDNSGETDSLYSRHLYEHSLPRLAPVLTKHCSLGALRLFADLLFQAALIDRKIEIDPPKDYTSITSNALVDADEPPYDIFGTLVQTVKYSAAELVQRKDVDVKEVVGVLASRSYRVFKRLLLHVLAKNPAGAPGLADELLLSESNLEDYTFRHEYAELAIARYSQMPKDKQDTLLALVDAAPNKHLDWYRKRILDTEKREATAEDIRAFTEYTIRDTTFYWRQVLPPERQVTLDRIVKDHGEPDAWRRVDELDISPRSAADFAASPVAETAAYLRAWTPSEPAKQTMTALGMELRNAVSADPAKFSAGAAEFRGLPFLYIRRVIEGLRTPTDNGTKIEWRPVLELIRSFLSLVRPPAVIDNSSGGDDPSGFWAAREAGELVRTGLGRGRDGIPFDCNDIVLELFVGFEKVSPLSPASEQFVERYPEHPYFASQQTMFGLTADMFVLYLFWSTKQDSSPLFSAPREAITKTPEFGAFARRALAQKGDNGKIARVVFGRFLNWLYYFGDDWVRSNFKNIFADDPDLHECAWLGHLLNDQPSKDLIGSLTPFYLEEIDRLGETLSNDKRENRANRLAEYIMVMTLWGALPDELLERFEGTAPLKLRRHALWFVGREMRRPDISEDVRGRGIAYWIRRLTAAEAATDKEQFREEIGVAGYWGTDSGLDTDWLTEQYLRMLRSGYAPSNGFSVVDWLGKICDQHPDDAVEIFDRLISNPKTDRWATTGHEVAVKAILTAGRGSGAATTLDRIDHIVGVLSSRGNSAFLNFARRS